MATVSAKGLKYSDKPLCFTHH